MTIGYVITIFLLVLSPRRVVKVSSLRMTLLLQILLPTRHDSQTTTKSANLGHYPFQRQARYCCIMSDFFWSRYAELTNQNSFFFKFQWHVRTSEGQTTAHCTLIRVTPRQETCNGIAPAFGMSTAPGLLVWWWCDYDGALSSRIVLINKRFSSRYWARFKNKTTTILVKFWVVWDAGLGAQNKRKKIYSWKKNLHSARASERQIVGQIDIWTLKRNRLIWTVFIWNVRPRLWVGHGPLPRPACILIGRPACADGVVTWVCLTATRTRYRRGQEIAICMSYLISYFPKYLLKWLYLSVIHCNWESFW